jgi:AcrR family transcriptional regulator
VERRVKDIRTSILTSAEQEFLEKGYEGTSIDGIVREVGGSKSTVYAHFGDKKQLFTETVARIRNDFDFALTRARAGAPAAPREGLVVLAEDGLDTATSSIADYLRAATEAGTGPAGDVERCARHFVVLLIGDAHLRVLLGLRRPPQTGELAEMAAEAADAALQLAVGATNETPSHPNV